VLIVIHDIYYIRIGSCHRNASIFSNVAYIQKFVHLCVIQKNGTNVSFILQEYLRFFLHIKTNKNNCMIYPKIWHILF